MVQVRFQNDLLNAVICMLWGAVSAFLVFLIMQIMLVQGSPFTMPWKEMLNNELLCFGVFLFLFFIASRYRLSIILGSVLLLLLGTVNYYVFAFRGGELTPMDFLSLRTAANVVGGYSLTPDRWFAFAWSGLLCILFLATVFNIRSFPKKLLL